LAARASGTNVALPRSAMMLRFVSVLSCAALAAACVDKVDPAKGELDDELPPGSPLAAPAEGKSDGGGSVLRLNVESAHPYTNNLDRVYPVDLAGLVPGCVQQARVHFASIRTEAGYDFVHVEGSLGRVDSFDGERTDVWSNYAPIGEAKRLSIRLDTDESVVRDGFRIDAVELLSGLRCPAPPIFACPAGQVDVTPVPGPCECRGATRCAPAASVTLEHAIGGGFAGTVNGSRAVGTTASRVVYKPGEPEQVTAIGTIDAARLQTVVDFVVAGNYLGKTGAAESSNWNETISAAIAPRTYTTTRAQGTHPADDAALASKIDELFTCGNGGALTCGAGQTCQTGQCVASQGCFCPANYDPVCGSNGRTYSNGCAAACAQAEVRHPGECGIAGDPCGTLLGLTCKTDNKCRYGAGQFTPPFPDAGGACVVQNYCDAAADCAGLIHPAVPGTWGCTAAKTCAWQAGPAWRAFDRYTSAHPYGNRASEWKQLYAPEGAAKVRLIRTGTFELEQGYDFLEAYAWRNSQWTLVKRWTGTVGPAATEELAGRYFYLRFASDSSITKYGFDVSAEWAN
jgi:hypothetical protein